MMRRVESRDASQETFRYFVTDKGTRLTHFDCISQLERAIRSVRRWFPRVLRTRTLYDDPELRSSDLDQIRYVLDELASYIEIAQRALDDAQSTDRRDDRIRALRRVAGRTPEEAEAYLAKAAELESRP